MAAQAPAEAETISIIEHLDWARQASEPAGTEAIEVTEAHRCGS